MSAPREENEGRIRSGKLAGRSLAGAIWILAVPVLLQQTMQACVGLADKVIAGDLPAEIVVPALDGLGIGSYVGWLIGIAMAGLGIGGQALIARSMGAGALGQGERALGQAMLLSLVWGLLVGVTLWMLAPPLARVCRLSPEASVYCIEYVRYVSYALPLYGLMMVGSMCLHGAGETAKPAAIAITVNLVNIACSWALSGADVGIGDTVLENPFTFDLHVVGIAVGTSISYAVGAILTAAVLLRGVQDLRLHASEMSPDPPMMRRLVRVGVPTFFEGISMWAVNLVVLLFIGIIAAEGRHGGEGLQGAHIIAVQWESFSFMPGFAIGTAAGALAGQYLGADNPRMASRAVLACTAVAVVLMGGLGIVFILGGAWLTAIVSTEPVHLEHTPKLLAICGATQIFFATAMVVRQGLRGVGDTSWTLIITTVSSYGVRLPAAWLLGVTLGLGLEGIWIALCGELAVRAMLFGARFLHGGWKSIQV